MTPKRSTKQKEARMAELATRLAERQRTTFIMSVSPRSAGAVI